METKYLKKIIQEGSRISGNRGFPALNKNMIGKKVKVIRNCVTWDGCLGYFDTDENKRTFAFWCAELSSK